MKIEEPTLSPYNEGVFAAMIVKVNGKELKVAEEMTFAQLLQHVQGLLKDQDRVLVELRLDGETVSQTALEELQDRPLHGQIELFSLDASGLVAEITRQADRFLQQLEGQEFEPSEFPELIETFTWLNRALRLIPLGVGFPELERRVRALLEENAELQEWLRSAESADAAELERLQERLQMEFAEYREVFREIAARLRGSEEAGPETKA